MTAIFAACLFVGFGMILATVIIVLIIHFFGYQIVARMPETARPVPADITEALKDDYWKL